jgi:hypothetical protein
MQTNVIGIGVLVNAWYEYILSMTVSKNLPDQYQNCTTNQMLKQGEQHKMKICVLTIKVIFWSYIIQISYSNTRVIDV